MGWDDDGDKNNPWQPKRDKPADLDAIVRDLKRRLSGLIGGRGGKGSGGGGGALSGGAIGAVIVILLGVWAATGLYTVDAAERAVVLRFGKYETTTQPGLHWHLPWPIESAETVNTGATERWSYQGSMLTRDENIIIVDLVVQYRRADPFAYLFSMRDPELTLRDVTASAIREIVGKNDLDFILTQGRAEIAAKTQELLQATLDSYKTGITVYAVNLQEANFPPEVEGAVQDAVKAREDRERRILEAQSYENDILPKARGQAAQRRQDAEAYRAEKVANAQGEADRFTDVLAEYQKAPKVTRERMYLETLEAVLANSTKVLVNTENGSNVLYLPLDQLRRTGASGGNPADTGSQTQQSASSPAQSNAQIRQSRSRTVR